MIPYGSLIGVGGFGPPAVLQDAEDLFDEMQKDRRSRFGCFTCNDGGRVDATVDD